MALTDHLALVTAMVRGDGGTLGDDDYRAALAVAVIRYGKDKPRTMVADMVSLGGTHLPLPEGWVAGVSAAVSLETPPDQEPPQVTAGSAVMAEEVPTGWRLRLVGAIPAGQAIRLRWTAPHTVDDIQDTIPATDREAVAAYASAHLLDALAAEKSADIDSSIGAADVGRRSVAQEYAARAKTLRQRYSASLGLDSDRVVPAGTVVSVARPDSLGVGRLTHGRHRRGI